MPRFKLALKDEVTIEINCELFAPEGFFLDVEVHEKGDLVKGIYPCLTPEQGGDLGYLGKMPRYLTGYF